MKAIERRTDPFGDIRRFTDRTLVRCLKYPLINKRHQRAVEREALARIAVRNNK